MRLTHEERARGGSKNLSLIHKGEKAINPEEEKEKNRNHLKIRATGRRRERKRKIHRYEGKDQHQRIPIP